jgi:hypothetical protein
MSWFWKSRKDKSSGSLTPPQAATPPSAHSRPPAASAPSIQEMPLGVAPEYWLGLTKANEAIMAFVAGSPGDIIGVLVAHPILMLPEFPAAIEAQGRADGDSATVEVFAALADNLREKQNLIRQVPTSYATLADLCGRRLGNDEQGDPRINLHYAAGRFSEAAALFDNDEERADALVNEAHAYGRLAQLGVHERANLEKVIQLARRASAVYGAGAKADGCAHREAWAKEKLTHLGAETPSTGLSGDSTPDAYWLGLARNIGVMDAFAAAQSEEEAKELLKEHPMVLLPELPLALETEANGSPDPQVAEELRRLSLKLAKFQLRCEGDIQVYSLFMIHCANEVAYCKHGEPRTNLRRALEIFGPIRKLQPEGTIGARGRISEAIVRQMLAELGVDTRTNLDEALRLCRAAAEFYGPSYELCQGVEAKIRRQLALQQGQPSPSG